MLAKEHIGKSFQTWNIDEIYLGVDSQDLHIPNAGDLVVDPDRGYYIVASVDPQTKIPVLNKWEPWKLGSTEQDDDLNSGLSRNYAKGSNRAFVNFDISPPTLKLDARTYFYDAEAETVKIFRGKDTSENGTVISRVFDNNGTLISENVDLVRVYPDNAAIKYLPAVHLDTILEAGEVITAVAYSSNGGVLLEEQFVVRLTDAIRSPDMSNKYLTNISLVSDLLDPQDPTRILNDLNVPFNTTLMKCRLHYNDGSYVDIGIDGIKAKLFGIENFNESVLGPATTAILMYQPSTDEAAINTTGANAPTLHRQYQLANQLGEAQFGFKLYALPVWQDIGLGYQMTYRLTNLEYDIDVDVTAQVTTTLVNGNPWSPTNYGNKQTLQAVLRLDDIMPGLYPGHIHVQRYDVILDVPTDGGGDSWIIDYATDGSRILGYGIYAEASNLHGRINIQNDYVNRADWLDKLYYETLPAYDSDLVGAAPLPTHFKVTYGNNEKIFPIDEWDKYLYRDTNDPYVRYSTAIITWLSIDGPTTYTVAHTPLLIRLLD